MGNSHLIVVFDCSGSMGQPFQAKEEEIRGADYWGTSETKILEAKDQLIARLKKSDFQFITIIPFNTHALPAFSREIPKYQTEVENFIRSIQAGGNTNLAEALSLAIEIGNKAEKNKKFSYIRHLIITDGLSHTPQKDIELVETLSENQGIDIILIDPTEEGERHLNKLRKRGHLFTVASASQLRKTLADQTDRYASRIQFNNSLQMLSEKSFNLEHEFGLLSENIYVYARQNERLVGILSQAFSKARGLLSEANQRSGLIKEHILNHDFPESKIQTELANFTSSIEKVESLVECAKNFIRYSAKNYKISLFHPKLLSKRYPSPFIVNIYPQRKREEVIRQLESELKKWVSKHVESIHETKLQSGMIIIIQITSPDIDFSEKVAKDLEDDINSVHFTGKPKDTCYPGIHTAILSVSDERTNRQIQSISFNLKVVDFAFDHVSRPALSKISSAVLGLGSLCTFTLTLIGKIDQTLGISFGALIGAFAIGIFGSFISLFRTTQPSGGV